MRALALPVLLLLAGVLRAGGIEDAARMLAAPDAKTRRAGIDRLVLLDSRRSLDVLVQALRAAHKDNAEKLRAYRKALEKSTKELEEMTRELETAAKEKRPPEEAFALLAKARDVMAAEAKRIAAANAAFLPHLALLTDGSVALAKFTSEEAVARLEELARNEPGGPVRGACLRALVGISTPGMVPTLLALAADRDPRVRAIAVRALRRHVAETGVVEQIEASSRDKSWQVRRGAYASLAAAPPERAAPPLEAARASETGDQLRLLDRLLHAMGKGPEPLPAQPSAFGLPLTSTRVRFVLDLSQEMRPKLAHVRAEMGRALDALPDGALFEIVGLALGEVKFASAPERATAASRERARQWLAKLSADGPGDVTRLFSLLMPDYEGGGGERLFEALPDAVYLVFHEADGEGAAVALKRFAVWNSPCDAAFHARAFGEKYPREEMEALAKATGGAFVAGK